MILCGRRGNAGLVKNMRYKCPGPLNFVSFEKQNQILKQIDRHTGIR
jgi:hypothetical protein